ncbi:unnamed protein product [Meganyctiphanes norvegica]|uniref:Uncharacterized protein n=1 Tax=Meganyctiphanes norvegica TaxID=48144 RepID=A0AAV2Q6J8_MEGNR
MVTGGRGGLQLLTDLLQPTSTSKKFRNKRGRMGRRNTSSSLSSFLDESVFAAIMSVCEIAAAVVHLMAKMFTEKQKQKLPELEAVVGHFLGFVGIVVLGKHCSTGLTRLLQVTASHYSRAHSPHRRYLSSEMITRNLFDEYKHWLEDNCLLKWIELNKSDGFKHLIASVRMTQEDFYDIKALRTLITMRRPKKFLFTEGGKSQDQILSILQKTVCVYLTSFESITTQMLIPMLESFAFPLSIAMNIGVCRVVRMGRANYAHQLILGTVILAYLLCWQFAQFTVVIVLFAVYAMYTMGFINPLPMLLMMLATTYAFLNNIVLQFGNPLLLASPLAGCLLGLILLYVFLEPLIQHLPAPTNTAVQLGFIFISCGACKIELSRIIGVEDDAHVFNILKSKFTNFSDFHTLLYTCSPEFDFMPRETFYKLSETLLLPCVMMVSVSVFINSLIQIKNNLIQRMEEDNPELKTNFFAGIDPGVVYNFIMFTGYGVMAVLIMRLKLFFTPQLCAIVSLLATRKYWRIIEKKKIHMAILAVLVSGMCAQGFKNITEQRSIVGEYSNPELEELIEWVNAETNKDAVFAGPMSTMANLLLSTNRPNC